MGVASRDVIVAPATAPGRAAIALVRVTGDPLFEVLEQVIKPRRPGPWVAQRVRRVDVWSGAVRIDDGLAVLFRAPRSYTGDDLCELSVHANPRIVEQVISAFLDAGARLAQPGELTRRAVVRGKLDLVQAEGIDALIRATSADGIRLAQRLLGGALSTVLASMRTEFIGIAAELEAKLDWPGDDLALQSDDALVSQMMALSARAADLSETYRSGRICIEGARVAIVGPVNAGKSSLFNRLIGEDRAIVHPTPGTTRDVVEARTMLGSVEVTLLDTAGERDNDETILDPIERMGIERGRSRTSEVDLVLVVIPADAPDLASVRALQERLERGSIAHLTVFNRTDLPGASSVPASAIGISALTGAGIDVLEERIAEELSVGRACVPNEVMLSSVRQRDLLIAISEHAAEAARALPMAGPAVAADLIAEVLEEIDATGGNDAREAVLDEVFRRFCIGK